MIGIYLLVTLFAQFSGTMAWEGDLSTSQVELSVAVEKLNGVKVGTPVLVAGNLIGSVSKIGIASSDTDSFLLNLKISPRFRSMLKVGTIALIGSTLTTSRIDPEIIVELFIPPKSADRLPHGSRILGYTSYEQFWSKGFNA